MVDKAKPCQNEAGPWNGIQESSGKIDLLFEGHKKARQQPGFFLSRKS